MGFFPSTKNRDQKKKKGKKGKKKKKKEMKMTIAAMICYTILLTNYFHSVFALKCWGDDSSSGQECDFTTGEIKKEEFEKTCDKETCKSGEVCLRETFKLGGGGIIVRLDCGSAAKMGCHPGKNVREICACKSDLCNGGITNILDNHLWIMMLFLNGLMYFIG